MSGLSNIIIFVYVSMVLFPGSESQVTVSNLNGTGTFLCGYSTRLECAIPAYGGGMNWKLDDTIIAKCAFGFCTALGALPYGDIFTYDESAGKFNLDIGITYADNETVYECNDGITPDQTTVNIQVSPSYDAFSTDITERNTFITVEAGCFYPSDAGRMDVYCVNGGVEEAVEAAITLTPTTTGCTGDCAGPNIYTAVGSYAIDSYNMGGNSIYRFKTYHKDFKQYAISKDSTAIYNCGISKFTSTSATTARTSTTSKYTTYPPSTTILFTTSSTKSTSTPTTITTTSPTSTSTTKNKDNETSHIGSVIGYTVGATSGFFILVMLTIYLVWRFRLKRAKSETQDASPRIANEKHVISTITESYGNEESKPNYETLAMQNRDTSNYSDLVNLTSDQYQNTVVYESM